MTSSAGQREWNRRGYLLLGGLVTVACLAWAFTRVEWSRVGEALRDSHPWPWLPLAAVCYLAGHVARGWRCRRLVSRDARLPLATAANIVVIGYAGNNLLPARGGELIRAWILADRTGLPYAQSLTVTFLERVLDGLAILGLLLAGAWITGVRGIVVPVVAVATGIFGLALVTVLLAVLFPDGVARTFSRVAGWINGSWSEAGLRFGLAITRGVAPLRQPAEALTLLLFSLLVWSLETMLFAFVLPAFGLPLDAGWALLAMGMTNLAILAPSSPGFIGVFHFACAQALVALGQSNETALAYAFAVHATFYVPVTLWGVAAFTRYGLELGTKLGLARAARETAGLPRSSAADGDEAVAAAGSPFLASLVETMLPGETLPEAADDRRRSIDETARFVAEQVERLPRRLRWLFRVGMLGFRGFVRLRYLRGFSSLRLDRRTTAVEAWAYGPDPLRRGLFKVVRSTALLHHYDRPAVQERLRGPA